MNAQELFAALHRDGHVGAADAPPMAEVAPRPPWYVRVLLGFIGWLGGLLVLGFFAIFVSGLLNNAAGMSVISAMLFFGSFTIYRIAPHNEFASQFALAASICAQALAAGAFWRITGHGIDTAVVAGFIAAMQALLVWLMPNFLHRLLSTIFAVAALFFATHDGHASVLASLGLGVGFVMLLSAESRLIADGRHQLVDPVLNGLAIGLLGVGVGYLDFGGTRWLPFATFSALAFGVALLLWLVQNTKTSDPRSRTAAL
ncbi:MAG: DUF4401 domain-containing protein, partial [Betaproteobacteria bacterium]|nr:DUF4401 domain-containing protein [Betaproteobacteria bacterium]